MIPTFQVNSFEFAFFFFLLDGYQGSIPLERIFLFLVDRRLGICTSISTIPLDSIVQCTDKNMATKQRGEFFQGAPQTIEFKQETCDRDFITWICSFIQLRSAMIDRQESSLRALQRASSNQRPYRAETMI